MECAVGDGQAVAAARPKRRRPERQDIEVQDPGPPSLPTPPPERVLDYFKNGQELRRRKPCFRGKNGIGVAASTWPNGGRRMDPRQADGDDSVGGHRIDGGVKDLFWSAVATVGTVRTQRDEKERWRDHTLRVSSP